MLATLPTGTIRTIPADQLDEAAGVLAQSFMDYPVMRYCFADQGHYYERAVRALFRFNCERRAASGGVHLGAYEDGALVGVAGIAPTGEAPMSAAFQSRWGWFEALIGPQATARVERFSQLTEQHRLPMLYLSLSVLGVLPEAQGRRHDRALLDATHALAETHPFTDGVYLDTETAANVALYERFGYRVVSREQLDDLTIWCMFRPNGG
jgi:ribosomal protein S18 acetylase RimI-like enzyme